jgi:MFS family permease
MEVHAERRYQVGPAGSTDKVVFRDITTFGLSYWYIVALCIVFYSAIFPFETFAYKFFMDVHHTTREAGGDLVGMLTIFTMFGTPFFGKFADRVGKRALLMMIGSVLLIPVYLMMAYLHSSTYLTVYFPSTSADGHFAFMPHSLPPILLLTMAMMGVAFSLIPAVMWPSVAYIVDQSKLGTAYGLMTMIQNIGLAGFNLMIGWANDHNYAGADNPNGYRMGCSPTCCGAGNSAPMGMGWRQLRLRDRVRRVERRASSPVRRAQTDGYESAGLAGYFGRRDHSASYSFWYSDDLETIESASATASANLYNEKSSKPHLNE